VPAIAGDIGRIGTFRDDAFDPKGAGLLVKGGAETDLVIVGIFLVPILVDPMPRGDVHDAVATVKDFQQLRPV